jgi:hypothetical protein
MLIVGYGGGIGRDSHFRVGGERVGGVNLFSAKGWGVYHFFAVGEKENIAILSPFGHFGSQTTLNA